MSFPKYAHYKDSGVEWLGEVPAHWDVKSIRRVAELNPSKSEAAHLGRETEVSFLPMEAVGDDGKLNLDRTRPIGEVETGYTFFKEGDVTIAKITPCFENGKGAVMTGLQNGFGFGTTELIVTRPKLGHVTNHFLHWLYLSTTFRKTAEAAMYGAGGQKRVPDDFVRDFVTAFPPISEQDTISDFLARETTKLDALITEQRTLIDLLKEKRQAVISHAVTKGLDPRVPMKDSGVEWLGEVPAHWEVVRVRHAVAIDNSLRFPINREERAEMAGQYPYWGPTGIIDHIDHFRYEGARALIGEDGDHFTKHSIWAMTQWATGQFNVNNHAHVIADGPKCMARWFYFSFLHRDIGNDLIAQGVSRLKLTREGLSNLWLAVPPLDEQIATMSHLEATIERQSEITKTAQLQISLLEERRSALISAAVTGKIDVRQHATEAA